MKLDKKILKISLIVLASFALLHVCGYIAHFLYDKF